MWGTKERKLCSKSKCAAIKHAVLSQEIGTALKISHSPYQNLGILDMPKSQFLPYDPHNPPAYVAPCDAV